MYKPFKHDWISALKQCRLLWLLCCRPSAPRRCNKHKKIWECALQTLTGPTAPVSPSWHSLPICLMPTYVLEIFGYFILFAPWLFLIYRAAFSFWTTPPLPSTALLHHSKEAETRFSYRFPPCGHSPPQQVWAGLTPGNHSQVTSFYWLWWKHFSLEFGSVDRSFPKEDLGYL